MLNNLNNLFSMGGGVDVYVTVSQSGIMEMIAVDKTGAVKSYAQTSLNYNAAQREIANYSEFKDALETLFQMRNINPAKANIHLSIPTVWFGLKEGLPLLLDDSAITNVVIGELEQTYVFKRKDPIPFWFDALASTNSDSRSVFYTAVQEEVVEQVKNVLEGIGAKLVSVQCSLFADLKGLYVSGIAQELMNDGQSWSMMIINNSGFQMLGLQGKKILEYYEEPLPLLSYEGEEIYAAIENAARIALMSTASSSLLILSETDLVSAEILAGRLQFGGATLFVEDNQFRKEPLADLGFNVFQEDQIKVSLHAIGAISPAGIMPVEVDFLSTGGSKAAVEVAVIEIPIGDSIYELTPNKAIIVALLLMALVIPPVMLARWYTGKQVETNRAAVTDIETQITQLDEQLKAYTDKPDEVVFDPVTEIEKVLRNNRKKIMAYAALGESIPNNLYLTYFLTGAEGSVNVKGCADSVEDVYVFFKNLKDSLPESKLRLSKLDLKSGSLDKVINSTVSTVDTAPYIFEITNMDDSQLKSFMGKLTGEKKNEKEASNTESQDANQQNNNDNNSDNSDSEEEEEG